jgi:hypothetical protein
MYITTRDLTVELFFVLMQNACWIFIRCKRGTVQAQLKQPSNEPKRHTKTNKKSGEHMNATPGISYSPLVIVPSKIRPMAQ